MLDKLSSSLYGTGEYLLENVKDLGVNFSHKISSLGVQKAYGDIYKGEYFCGHREVEEVMYKDKIADIDYALNKQLERGLSEEDAITSVFDYNHIINDISKCLKEVHNVDPDTVAQLDNVSKELVENNLDKVYEIVPEFVKYADVPFTGNPILDTAIIVGGVAGFMTYAKISGKFNNLFYNKY